MDLKILPLQLFSFVCRVLKDYEVCLRGNKSLEVPRYEWVNIYVDAMFVCLLNELSWEGETFCQVKACQRNISPGPLIGWTSSWLPSDWPTKLNLSFLWQGDF